LRAAESVAPQRRTAKPVVRLEALGWAFLNNPSSNRAKKNGRYGLAPKGK
jgi:hypothetical protein